MRGFDYFNKKQVGTFNMNMNLLEFEANLLKFNGKSFNLNTIQK